MHVCCIADWSNEYIGSNGFMFILENTLNIILNDLYLLVTN